MEKTGLHKIRLCITTNLFLYLSCIFNINKVLNIYVACFQTCLSGPHLLNNVKAMAMIPLWRLELCWVVIRSTGCYIKSPWQRLICWTWIKQVITAYTEFPVLWLAIKLPYLSNIMTSQGLKRSSLPFKLGPTDILLVKKWKKKERKKKKT